MAIVKLQKTEWRGYFSQISQALADNIVEIEIDVGTLRPEYQGTMKWALLSRISYDAKKDLIELLLEGTQHSVHKPQEIYVDYGANGLSSLMVTHGDAMPQLIQLRAPLMLRRVGDKDAVETASTIVLHDTRKHGFSGSVHASF